MNRLELDLARQYVRRASSPQDAAAVRALSREGAAALRTFERQPPFAAYDNVVRVRTNRPDPRRGEARLEGRIQMTDDYEEMQFNIDFRLTLSLTEGLTLTLTEVSEGPDFSTTIRRHGVDQASILAALERTAADVLRYYLSVI